MKIRHKCINKKMATLYRNIDNGLHLKLFMTTGRPSPQNKQTRYHADFCPWTLEHKIEWLRDMACDWDATRKKS